MIHAFKREVAIQEEMNTYADLDFDARVSAYVKDLRAGLEELNGANPQSSEECHTLFLMKKRMVNLFLMEATIDENREIQIKVRVDLLKVAGQEAGAKQKACKSPEEKDSLAQGLSQTNEFVAVL